MLIAWNNKADAALLTAGSEIATLPGSSVQIPHLSRKWHTAAGVKASYLIWDFGAAVSIGLGVLLGTNLTASATVRWRGSTVDPTGIAGDARDTGVVNAGVKAGYGASYKSWTHASARYWRVDVDDAALVDNIQVGRALPLPYWQPSVNQLWDWSVTPLDPSRRTQSYGGQTFLDIRPKKRVLQFQLSWMGEAEMYGNAFELARANGIVKDVLAVPDISGAYLSEQAVWGLIEAAEPLVHQNTRIYRMKYSIEERL